MTGYDDLTARLRVDCNCRDDWRCYRCQAADAIDTLQAERATFINLAAGAERVAQDRRHAIDRLRARVAALETALRDVVACALIEEPTSDVMIDAVDRARALLDTENPPTPEN